MIPNSKQLLEWKSALNEGLGPRWRKHLTHIAVTLECVSKGVKPAFLWDVGPTITPGHLSDVVSSLKAKELVTEDVRVVTLAGDALVVNVATLREAREEFGQRERAFVDVSGLEARLVATGSRADGKCREMCAGLSDAFAVLGPDETDLPVDGSWCVPSVFGLLCGYPYVYWYDQAACEEPRCLDGAGLHHYTTHAAGVQVHSFTVPVSAAGGRRLVDRWFGRLTDKLRGHLWLSSLRLEGERVVMSRVVL